MANERKAEQLETPQKNKITGAAEFCAAKGIEATLTKLAAVFHASRYQVYYVLQSTTNRTLQRSSIRTSNAKKLSEQDLTRVEEFLTSNGPEGHELTWDELGQQFDLEVTGRTLRNNMAARRVYKFIAAEKPYIDEKLAKLRIQWCQHMLEQYPAPEEWRHVRFSDEVHFGWGPQGNIRHCGRDWRGHPDCVHRKETRDRKNNDDTKRLHYWAAIGWNFKSPLV